MSPAPSGRDDFFTGFQLEHVQVGLVRLRVRHVGCGPAVVLLHGTPAPTPRGGRSRRCWPATSRVVCPDLRGYGASTTEPTRPDHDHDQAQAQAQAPQRVMTDDVLALMRTLGHERFVVVGHDRGAYVAHRLAMDHPDAVRRSSLGPTLIVTAGTIMGAAATPSRSRSARAAAAR